MKTSHAREVNQRITRAWLFQFLQVISQVAFHRLGRSKRIIARSNIFSSVLAEHISISRGDPRISSPWLAGPVGSPRDLEYVDGYVHAGGAARRGA